MAEPAFEQTPDGGIVITLDDAQLENAALIYDDDEPNLVPAFEAAPEGQLALAEIGRTVVKRFDADWDASTEYRERFAEDTRILFGDLSPKEFPFQESANCHMPILLKNTIILVFRMESEIFGDWSSFCSYLPTGPDDDEGAKLVQLHTNWQFREKLTDFPREQARALLFFIFGGDVSGHSYWDPLRKVNVHETLTCDEFVTPYAYKTTRPDYSDLPHYTKVMRRYPHELRQMAEFWSGVEDLLSAKPPNYDQEPEDVLRRARAEAEGVQTPNTQDGAPYKLLWHEGWFMLPGQDRQRFCQAIVDHGTKRVLSLLIQEEIDWQDKQRFERQTAEMEQYRAASSARMQAQSQVMGAQAQVDELARMGAMGTLQHQGAQAAVAAAGSMVPPEPPMPRWMKRPLDMPKQPRKVPVYMFVHGVCMEPMVGNLGLAFGRILADLNRAANTALSQYTDSATLGNIVSLLTTENVELESPVEFKPGAVIKVPGVPPGQLEGNIQQLQFQPANPQMLDIVRIAQEEASDVAAGAEVLSGDPGKSGETARGFFGRVEQALAQLSVAARHYANGYLKQQLKNNARLNAIYLDDEEFFNVLDHEAGTNRLLSVGRKLYERNYQVSVSSDLKFSSQAQKIQEADQLMMLPGTIPPLQQNLAFIYTCIVKSLQARGRYDLIPLLGPKPPVPQMFGLPSIPPPPQMPGAPPPGAEPPQPGAPA